ncbi:MAG: serpin family protein, partial [Chloroflexi bacterium]|nr:serpin family protein [Chloroflexota bacterium]
FASCAPTQAGEVIQSEKQRITSPNVNQADLTVLVDGNNAFAFDAYQALKKADGNLFFSPYSISLALAMTYAGARGTTAQQMASALHFTLPQGQLHPAFNSLDTELSQRGQGAKGKDGKGFRLNIVNAIWGQKGYKFLPEFLDTLAQNYGAGLRTLDFKQASEASRIIINDWVSQQTEGRIKDLIPRGAIDTLTRLVLTNAIYFNAAWQFPFQKEATKDGVFHLLDGREVTVPMMRQTERLGYTEGTNYQAVELPYDGRQLSMIILLPRAGQFAEFEKSLDANQLKAITRDMSSERIALTMPRYKFTSECSLSKTLTAMGMSDAFGGSADFSGMTGNRELLISDVFHKAFVAVDEEGTEAAAATAVIMAATAMPGAPIEVTVDRPFIFLIRDIETGTLLFIGRVLNPSV